MGYLILIVFALMPENIGKQFPTQYISLPELCGNSKVASGLIYVKRGDKVTLQKSFGWADYLEKKPFTPTVQIYIGSLKKQFIAAAILKLMNEGKLKLDAPVSAYISFNKDLAAKDSSWVDNTTLHHLLTHVSDVNTVPLQPSSQQFTPLDKIYMGSISPPNPLRYRYNSVAYSVLESIIEAVSGMSAADYITHHFIKSLDMKHTLFHGGPNIPNKVRDHVCVNLCYPYYFFNKKETVVSAYNPNQERPFGGADMISTAEDLCKWNKALHSGKVFDTTKERSNCLLQIMLGLYTVDEEGDSYYGYGIKTFARNGGKIYWHEGLVTGASVYLEYDPQNDTHIVVISNTTGVSFNAKTGTYILDHLNDGVFE